MGSKIKAAKRFQAAVRHLRNRNLSDIESYFLGGILYHFLVIGTGPIVGPLYHGAYGTSSIGVEIDEEIDEVSIHEVSPAYVKRLKETCKALGFDFSIHQSAVVADACLTVRQTRTRGDNNE